MPDDAAADDGAGSVSDQSLPGQDAFVENVRPDPAQPAPALLVLEGLLGDSDRPGCKRLYLNRELTYFAEFGVADVLHTEPIPQDQSPMVGLDGTRVTLHRNATIHYTWERTARPLDEFDLDIRLGSTGAASISPTFTRVELLCTRTLTFMTCRTCKTVCEGKSCNDLCATQGCA